MTQAHIAALRASVTRLRDIAATLSNAELTGGAYPEQWSIAQALSHLGSGAVIMQRRLEDTLTGRPTPDDFAPEVWDTWNAKSPTAQRDDAFAADAALLARIERTTPEQRSGFAMSMGPMQLTFTDFVAMRLNEHAFHTWDVEVVGNPGATLPGQIASLVVDNLGLVARCTAKPTGDTAGITVTTVNPQRGFTIDLTADDVTIDTGPAAAEADLTIPAETFARLVYGRLDAAHTPAGLPAASLETLRLVFPGP